MLVTHDPLPPSAIQSSCVAVFLFDQLVRAEQDRCRHIEAKRLGGLHIEHGLVFRSNFARSSAAISLEPDSELYVARLSFGPASRLSMMHIIASLA